MKAGVQISLRPPLESPCFTTGALLFVYLDQSDNLIGGFYLWYEVGLITRWVDINPAPPAYLVS